MRIFKNVLKILAILLLVTSLLYKIENPALAATVIKAAANPTAVIGHGTKIYIANSNGTISVIDTANSNAVKNITLGSGNFNLQSLVAVGNKIYAANSDGSSVFTIDTANDDAISTIIVGVGPRAFAISGKYIYTVNYGDSTVSVIDPTNNDKVITGIPVGLSPDAIVALSGVVYVADYNDGTFTAINTAKNNTASSVNVGSQPIAMATIGKVVYVLRAGGIVSAIDTANKNTITNISVGSNPKAMAVFGGKIFVSNSKSNTVSVIDTANKNAVQNVKVGIAPQALAILGNDVYVANTGDKTVSIIDTSNKNSVKNITVGANPQAIIAYAKSIYAVLADGTVYIYDASSSLSLSPSSATYNDKTITLNYATTLTIIASSSPGATDFKVKVGGATTTVSSVSVKGNAVTLALAKSIAASSTVTVDYKLRATNPIKNFVNFNVASFTGLKVLYVKTTSTMTAASMTTNGATTAAAASAVKR